MDRKEHFVKLTLSRNDQPIWIKIESIVTFYADTNLGGEAVTKIHTMDDDYSIVKETPDFIHYSIDEYFNAEWYREAKEDLEDEYRKSCEEESKDGMIYWKRKKRKRKKRKKKKVCFRKTETLSIKRKLS